MVKVLVAVVLGAVAVASVGTPAFAQVPDFSGHWVLQVDAGAPAGVVGNGGVLVERRPAKELTLKQDAKTLTLSRVGPNGEMKTVYTLDGTESRTTPTGGAAREVISSAKWDGSKLIIIVKRDIDGTTLTNSSTWWMDGANLKIETRTVETTGSGKASDPVVSVATYKKM